jgi:hypothetical protein
MTQHGETTRLQHARNLTRRAAQWLELLSFKSRPVAPTFSVSICYYHAMLDPEASDTDRLGACRAMRHAVQRRMLAEEFAAEEDQICRMVIDPYRSHWQTTRDGAALWAIENLLCSAIQAFEAEHITA